jgi:raffinose/stachyose/melibiose transport system permease protein
MASTSGTILPIQTSEERPIRWAERRWVRKVLIPWLFILPILLLHLMVVTLPALSSFYYSLTEWSGMGQGEFIGLDNFKRLIFDDPTYRHALGNNIKWMAFFLTVPFGLSLFAAFLLSQIKRGGIIYRLLIFIPYILPSVVTASIWRNLLNPNQGIGSLFGLDIALLGNSDTALLTIAFIDNWHFWGFLTVLFLTAMQSIAPELYDAAKIDGAGGWQLFRHITLPGIRPTILFMLVMTAIWSFLVFDYIWILTEGGPAGSSDVLGVLVYKNAFRRFEAGYAAAQGLTMSMFSGIIILIFLILRKLGWYEA